MFKVWTKSRKFEEIRWYTAHGELVKLHIPSPSGKRPHGTKGMRQRWGINEDHRTVGRSEANMVTAQEQVTKGINIIFCSLINSYIIHGIKIFPRMHCYLYQFWLTLNNFWALPNVSKSDCYLYLGYKARSIILNIRNSVSSHFRVNQLVTECLQSFWHSQLIYGGQDRSCFKVLRFALSNSMSLLAILFQNSLFLM